MSETAETTSNIDDLLATISKPAGSQLPAPAVKEPQVVLNEQYWMKKGYFRPYTLGKTSAGLSATGEIREYLARLFVLIKAYAKENAEQNGKRIDTELFDLMNKVISMIWRATGSDITPTVEQSANFLAMISGFTNSYLASTKITEKI